MNLADQRGEWKALRYEAVEPAWTVYRGGGGREVLLSAIRIEGKVIWERNSRSQ